MIITFFRRSLLILFKSQDQLAQQLDKVELVFSNNAKVIDASKSVEDQEAFMINIIFLIFFE